MCLKIKYDVKYFFDVMVMRLKVFTYICKILYNVGMCACVI